MIYCVLEYVALKCSPSFSVGKILPGKADGNSYLTLVWRATN